MPSRRRTTTPTRRPRVAGLTPDGARTDADGMTVTETRPPRVEVRTDDERARRTRPHAPIDDDTVTDRPTDRPRAVETDEAVEVDEAVAAPPAERSAGEPVEREPDPAEADASAKPTGRAGRLRLTKAAPAGDPRPDTADDTPGPLARLRTVPVLAGALVVLVALAVFFGVSTVALRGSPAMANTALTDVATTSEVSSQLGDALETVYSYDFARLDENERAAREVITTGFSAEFDRLFAQVRELAPQQQAIVSATIAVSAVQQIDGDRAVLVAFMDQQATTVANAEQAAAAGRLTVVGERVDGRWKIASVESR